MRYLSDEEHEEYERLKAQSEKTAEFLTPEAVTYIKRRIVVLPIGGPIGGFLIGMIAFL